MDNLVAGSLITERESGTKTRILLSKIRVNYKKMMDHITDDDLTEFKKWSQICGQSIDEYREHLSSLKK